MTDLEFDHHADEEVVRNRPRPEGALAAVERATARLLTMLEDMDDLSVREPSLLPGWSRAHVISHLARNADGCANLLTWARTGVEHTMYASRQDRDADISEGARRGHRLLVEDLAAASGRLAEAFRTLPSPSWLFEVEVAPGKPVPAREIPRIRLHEVRVHSVDLDFGFGFDDIPRHEIEWLLNDTVRQLGGRPDVPPLALDVEFTDGSGATWRLGTPGSSEHRVRGDAGTALGWLLGRTSADGLSGDPPELPPWL
ncbi:maleylpyruvate isomerase [Actinopolyspora xinjiangensis]|uniref:Maleylpyruvate isomerase n=1 Tax=Actinopolyspora xinjiangensis TaxID=405564 RepID=A0A1H0WQ79_9ACTN|nr:maleylpyruvate isomerase family mycothiol-dependent enzyme [Actinopolyspora xinjiangensis]SDP92426.1 maleylpyruvate isomerase [Actinopolyspora xinjiangensis]